MVEVVGGERGREYADLEELYVDRVFNKGEREQIVAAHRSGGLTEPEIEELLRTSPGVITEAEEYIEGDVIPNITDINGYMACLFDEFYSNQNFSVFGKDKLTEVSAYLPEIAAYFEDRFRPYNFVRDMEGKRLEKPVEYLLQSQSVWDELIVPNQGGRMLDTILEHTHNHSELFPQYLSALIDIAPGESTVLEKDVYPLVLDSEPERTHTLASTPLTTLAAHLPEEYVMEVEKEVPDERWEDATEIAGVRPRVRGIMFAGNCANLERYHWETLLSDDPSQENILIAMDDTLVGSLKLEGDNSILALRDVKSEGALALQNGYAYQPAYTLWNTLWDRMDDAEERDGWNVLEVDELSVNPIRRAGEKEYDVDTFQKQIDDVVPQLEDQLL